MTFFFTARYGIVAPIGFPAIELNSAGRPFVFIPVERLKSWQATSRPTEFEAMLRDMELNADERQFEFWHLGYIEYALGQPFGLLAAITATVGGGQTDPGFVKLLEFDALDRTFEFNAVGS